MHTGTCKIELYLPMNQDLKGKRRIVKSLSDQIRSRFNVSVSEIEKIIQSVLDDNKDMVSQYKSGKTKLLGYFVGQVMKRTKGKANPKLLNDLLIKMIS